MGERDKKGSSNLCLKFILTIVNAIVLLCEAALVGAVFYITTTEKHTLIELFGEENYELAAGVLIGVGVIVILITVLGAIGTILGNKALLKLVSQLSDQPFSKQYRRPLSQDTLLYTKPAVDM